MKKLILFFLMTLSVGMAFAQSEAVADTIRRDLPTGGMKEYGGFLLDMKLMNLSAPKLPELSWELPDASKDYNHIFQLNPDVTYSQGFTDAMSSYGGWRYGMFGESSSSYMQMGSFKLKNGMKLNTYGDYNWKGMRVPNQSAMPWEKNNFRGAFELKSENGSFGIKIEVQQGRRGLY